MSKIQEPELDIGMGAFTGHLRAMVGKVRTIGTASRTFRLFEDDLGAERVIARIVPVHVSTCLLSMILVLGACAPGVAERVDQGSPTEDTVTGIDTISEIASEDIPVSDLPSEILGEWPTPPEFVGTDRPAAYFVPVDYTPEVKWPLVILLHGRSVSGFLQDTLFQLSAQVDEMGFLLVVPDGTPDDGGLLCWNATGTCCKADGQGEDDVAYILSLMDEMATYYRVDQRRVYLIGHSNGGFMSYRMACEAGERIAAIVSLAGMDWMGPSNCVAEHPVGVLHVHGTDDDTMVYEGAGAAPEPYPHYGDYPSAEESAEGWATRCGCGAPEVGSPLDLEGDLAGAETVRSEWVDCEGDFRVALWTIEGGSHVPNVYDGTFAREAMAFLLSQSRDDSQ